MSPIVFEGVSALFIFDTFYDKIPVFNANSVDPDQTLHFAASDLTSQCAKCYHFTENNVCVF